MIEPTDKDIGRKVVYTGNHNGPLEYGIITSFNPFVVFVKYGNNLNSQATKYEDLEWDKSNAGNDQSSGALSE